MQNAPVVGAFCIIFDLHEAIFGLENQFLVFLSCRFRQVLLYALNLANRY